MNKIKSRNVREVVISLDYKKTLNEKLIKFNNYNNIYILYDFKLQNNSFIVFLKKTLKGKYIPIKLKNELTTDFVDNLTNKIKSSRIKPDLLIGVGGGSTLDCTKAISVLLTNNKKAENYQGWDLLEKKGVFSIGIPSLSGTGSESSRTCVLLNTKKNLKLGFNSKFTCFDKVFLFPQILSTVPKKLLFITASDAYFHSFELLNGKKRNKYADKLAKKSLILIKKFLKEKKYKNIENLKKLMIASFFAGEAISFSMVGLIHPFSAALSSIFRIPHCLSNCIVFRGLKNYYIKEYNFLFNCFNHQKITIENIIKINNKKFEKLYMSTMQHEKPLKNHLGKNFKKKLNYDIVYNIFKSI